MTKLQYILKPHERTVQNNKTFLNCSINAAFPFNINW